MMRREPPPARPVRGSVGLRVGRTRADPDELVVGRQVVAEPVHRDDSSGGGGGGRRFDLAALLRRLLASDIAVLAFLLLVAAALRLPNLEARGRFEYDQGEDMLTLRQFTQDGVIPLLGPKASVGDFHHGAFTFFLLEPAAWLSGSEPFGVVIEMALIGLAAVVATWWLGRVVGGRAVGTIAGLLFALSPAAVDESTFIWNPNPIPLFAAIAAGAAWKGHTTGRAAWWVVAIGSAAIVAQLHFLGLLFLPPIVGLLLFDLWRARRDRRPAVVRALVRGLLGGVAVMAVLYLPLAIYELQSGFAETRAVLAYLTAGSAGTTLDATERLVVTAFRVIGWPFIGVVTDVPVASTLVVAIVLVLVAWHAFAARGAGGGAARWLGLSILWSIVGLAIAAPTLANVTPGLPNDHYHAFVDPLLVVAVALAGVTLGRGGARIVSDPADRRVAVAAAPGGEDARDDDPRGRDVPGESTRVDTAARALLAIVLLGQVGLALARQPVADPNGGWPAARAAGQRLAQVVGSEAIDVRVLPVFEPDGGIRFPFVHAGGLVSFDGYSSFVVVGCDRLFEQILLAKCGGPAESEWLPRFYGAGATSGDTQFLLIDRFDLSPRESISVYRIAQLPRS
jgi:hypothetical protein